MSILIVYHTIVPPLSVSWWVGSMLSVLFITLSLKYLKTLSPQEQRKWEVGAFIYILVHLIVWQGYYFYSNTWEAGDSLPFQLCDMSRILGGVLLFKYNQYLFEFLLLLGLGGAFQSFLTPEISVVYHPITHFDYYLSHSLIMIFGLYLFYVKGKRPRKKSWLYVFVLGLIMMGLLAIFNHYSSGNYMYLCAKPIVENPLLMGDWPYYLIVFIGFGFVNIILSYWLFRWKFWDKN